MNRDHAPRGADRRPRLATVALLLTVTLVCWGSGGPSAWAQALDADPPAEASAPYTDFYAMLNSDEPKTVVFRWREEGTVEINGREQQLTGEQVRIDSTGDTYTVYYDEDGILLEEYSARHQKSWIDDEAGGMPLPPGAKEVRRETKAPLPPQAPLFEGDPTADLAYFAEPQRDPALRDPERRYLMRKREVKINPQELAEFSPGSGRTLTIDLFDGASIETRFSRLKQISSRSFVLAGEIEGEPIGDVTLSVDGEAVVGRVHSEEHGLFRLMGSATGKMELSQIDTSQLDPCGAEQVQPPPQTPSAGGSGASRPQAVTAAAVTGEFGTTGGSPDLGGQRGGLLGFEQVPPAPGGDTMDVMVAFTDVALSSAASLIADEGGEINGFDNALEVMRALIHLEIFDANTAYMNSEIEDRLRLVHIHQVDLDDTGSGPTDLFNFLAEYGESALRDFVGADFIHLITGPSDVCGVAFIRQSLDDFSELAVGLTAFDCFGAYVVAHEIGHNQGCAHDRGSNPAGGGPVEQGEGLFPDFSYAYIYKGLSGTLRKTVMRPFSEEPIPNFSNPDVIVDGKPTGVPIGDPDAVNNAETIRRSAPSSATWREAVTARQLANISTRGFTGTGLAQTMIAGFIVQNNIASGPGVMQKVLIRGKGPSLSAFGLSDLASDPKLTLMQAGATTPVMAVNDDWDDTQEAEILATGMQPSDGREAAILADLSPGIYTVLLEDDSASPGPGPQPIVGPGSGGLGLVEVFALENRAQSSKIFNISTRGQVNTGDEVMIGGFIVEGPEPSNVVVRARGTSLADVSSSDDLFTTNTLQDPVLEVFSGSTKIAENDDWVTGSQQAELNELGIAPEEDLESAVRLLLEPGAYTAILRGFSGLTGVAIVEVFDVNNAVPDIVLPSTTVDCGEADWPSGTSGGVLTVVNEGGNLPLVIGAFDDQLEGTPFFSTAAFFETVVPPLSSVAIPFTYTAQGAGESNSTTINLITNDPDTPTVTIKLKGRTVVPL